MSEAEVPSQKPLASYILPRRDESVVAHMPQSLSPARPASVSSSSHAAVRAPVSAPAQSPLAAPVPSAFSDDMREEDRTMIARSRFGDETSVHEERTVIGQIPKEALEFERMFAQRTQPPPPDEKPQKDPAETVDTARPPAPVPGAPPLPAFDSDSFGAAKAEPENTASESADDSQDEREDESQDEERESASSDDSSSDSAALGDKPSSDSRGLTVLAEATHPSVARSVTARRLRVTLITLLVIAVLVALFVIQMPR